MFYDNRFRLMWTPFLKKRKNRMYQAVGVVCPPILGSGGELKLVVGQQTYTATMVDLIHYPTGRDEQTDSAVYLWLVPRPAKPVSCRITWKTPSGQSYRDSLKLQPAEPTTVHTIFKTHLDLGYTRRMDDVVRDFQTGMMEKLLDLLDKTAHRKPGKRFVWLMSTWLVEQCLDPKRVTKEHRQRFEHYLRNGQVVWGLMPFTPHSEFLGFEEMCRSLYTARRLAERLGCPVPTAAKMTDVPAHTASIAMALAAAGGTFLQIGTNPHCLPPKVPPLFWWRLPDGKKLLCHYQGTYGTDLLPPPCWPWRHWLSLQVTSDNVGPHGLDAIHQMDWIEQHFDYPVCRTGRLEDFAGAVIRQHGNALPEIEKELVDGWIHGIASQAGPTAIARRAKDRLPSVEIAQTLAAWSSGKTVSQEDRDEVRRAYEQLALYSEHTWGDHARDGREALPKGNLYTSNLFGNSAPVAPVNRWVASWADKAQFAINAQESVKRAESKALSNWAGRIAKGKGDVGIALFNPLAWSRGGLVRIEHKQLPAGEFELIDPTTGGAVLYERRGEQIEFIAPPVPACGYLVLDVKPVSCRRQPGFEAAWDRKMKTLHVEHHSMVFHKLGGIARWHDRARSCQWCSDKAEFPMGSYLYEMPSGEQLKAFARAVHSNYAPEIESIFHRADYDQMSRLGPVAGGPAKITPEITSLYARVTIEGDCPIRKPANRKSGDVRRYRTTWTKYRGNEDFYVTLQLIGKRPTYAAEAGYALFSFAGEEPFVFVDRIAHIANAAEDFADRVNAAHMAVHHGVRIEGAHAGMNFYPLDTPLVGFGAPGAYRFNSDGEYKTGLLYATLFNNCWGTNFAQWQSGDFSFDFVLRPTGNDAWDGGLAQGGAELFRPLLATVVAGRQGDASASLLRVEPTDVQVIAIKPADFGSGIVIRLWNADVDPAKGRITFAKMRRGDVIRCCDLLERPTGRLIAVNAKGEAVVPFQPNEMVTLWLGPGRAK